MTVENKNILIGITGGIAAYKICELIRLFKKNNANVTNSDLELLLYPARAEKNSNRMPIDFPWIHRELAKKGVTMTLLWTEYCEQAYAAGKQPYMSTQFGDLYRKWARVSKATMRISRKPGECVFPESLERPSRLTGLVQPLTFTTVLPAKSLRLISSWEYCLAAALYMRNSAGI